MFKPGDLYIYSNNIHPDIFITIISVNEKSRYINVLYSAGLNDIEDPYTFFIVKSLIEVGCWKKVET